MALTLTSDTPRFDEIFSKPSFENRVFSKALAQFPFGAAPTAEEVARVAVFLVSDDSCQITGQTISITGGIYGHTSDNTARAAVYGLTDALGCRCERPTRLLGICP